MMDAFPRNVAIVGAGLVGLGWAIVFARAGLPVRVFDASEAIRESLGARVRESLVDMKEHGLLDEVEEVAARIRVEETLQGAVVDADYIQESVLERIDVKQSVCREISAAMRADAVVGSSTSGIPGSVFTREISNRNRFLVVHPVNPPHLVPLVELVATPWTDHAIVASLRQALEALGQVPIVVNCEIEGFVLNRLQGALLNEAFALYEAGVATVADIDKTVRDGLGFRWSFMGPFETIDLNAPGGVTDYAWRPGPLYHGIAKSRTAPLAWSKALIQKVEAERRQELPIECLKERSTWRDRRLMAFAANRQAFASTSLRASTIPHDATPRAAIARPPNTKGNITI